MHRYRCSYTVYLPEPKVTINRTRAEDAEAVRRSKELDGYVKRLDRQTQKLDNLDDECLSNLNKCNKYYSISQQRESRLNNSLRENKRTLRSQSAAQSIYVETPKATPTRKSKHLSKYSSTSKVKINLRIPESAAAKTTLADYLFSRSIAGMNSHELIQNIEKVTGNKISGRFFSFYPTRDVNFTSWLAYWLRKKAVPVALLNLQKTPVWGFIPDAWHHQMIYACDANNVFLTNPLEVKSTDTIMNELTSESVLLVRCYDVIKRFNANNSNLIELIRLTNLAPGERKRWLDMNVIGQVLSVLRENKCNQDNNLNGIASQNKSSINYDDLFDHANQMQTLETSNMAATADNTNSLSNHSTSTSSQTCASLTVNSGSNLTHICIPASYKSGITLFTYRDSDLFKEIMEANELPIAQK